MIYHREINDEERNNIIYIGFPIPFILLSIEILNFVVWKITPGYTMNDVLETHLIYPKAIIEIPIIIVWSILYALGFVLIICFFLYFVNVIIESVNPYNLEIKQKKIPIIDRKRIDQIVQNIRIIRPNVSSIGLGIITMILIGVISRWQATVLIYSEFFIPFVILSHYMISGVYLENWKPTPPGSVREAISTQRRRTIKRKLLEIISGIQLSNR